MTLIIDALHFLRALFGVLRADAFEERAQRLGWAEAAVIYIGDGMFRLSLSETMLDAEWLTRAELADFLRRARPADRALT